jgi:hypothetical protein
MRLVGAVSRLAVILAGAISVIIFIILSFASSIIWLLLPIVLGSLLLSAFFLIYMSI